MHKFVSAILATSLLAAAAPAHAELKLVSEGPVTELGAREYLLHSDAVGHDVLIEVVAPPGKAPMRHLFPVIYALDGGYGIVGPVGMLLGLTGAMEPSVVVSIGYRPANYGFRDADMLHRSTIKKGRAIGGGGGAFEQFLTHELRPFIESRYPADPGRAVLIGHSLAGVFATNVLNRNTGAYSAYLIASPTLQADPVALDFTAKVMAQSRGQRVYIAVGGKEEPATLASARKLATNLEAPGTGFAVTSKVFDGDNHGSYYAAMIAAALPLLLPPEP